MSPAVHQPHDKLFKKSMSDIRVAQNFMEANLPAELLKQLDLSTLKLQNNSFIDDIYKATEADVIYQIRTREGKNAYCYILCEQQSRADRWIAFRLAVYVVRLMEMHQKQYPRLNEIEVRDGGSFAKIMLGYVINGMSAEDEKLLLEQSEKKLSTNLRGEAMTLAQKFEQIGFEKGVQQGVQQGAQETLKLLQTGKSLEEIAELMNLSIEA